MPDQNPKAVLTQPSGQRLVINVQHFDETGQVLSELTLDYPRIGNAAANSFQLELVDALRGVVERFAKAKAAVLGEPWPEV